MREVTGSKRVSSRKRYPWSSPSSRGSNLGKTPSAVWPKSIEKRPPGASAAAAAATKASLPASSRYPKLLPKQKTRVEIGRRREVAHVAASEVDGETVGGGRRGRGFEKLRRNVDAGHRAAPRGERQREPAGSAGNVEGAGARRELQVLPEKVGVGPGRLGRHGGAPEADGKAVEEGLPPIRGCVQGNSSRRRARFGRRALTAFSWDGRAVRTARLARGDHRQRNQF